MAIKLVWTPKVRADLRKIYVDIARQQSAAADRYFGQFRRKVNLLIEQPRLGARHPEISPAARMLVQSPYVILYSGYG